MTKALTICTISNGGRSQTYFGERDYALVGDLNFMVSDRIDAQNFRLRSSAPGYQSDWHVAGDPTLLIILEGTIKIELRSGEYREFSVGDMFIAEDYLGSAIEFDQRVHGHRAEVVGEQTLLALHLKLDFLKTFVSTS